MSTQLEDGQTLGNELVHGRVGMSQRHTVDIKLESFNANNKVRLGMCGLVSGLDLRRSMATSVHSLDCGPGPEGSFLSETAKLLSARV
jgi:hypothetical protein